MTNTVEYLDTHAYWETVSDYDQQVVSIFVTENAVTEALRDFPDKPGVTVADFGCGVGNSFKHLREFRRVYAVDASSNMLEQAKAQLEDNVELVKGKIEDTRLPEKCGLTLGLASVMPESIDHFHVLMDNLVQNTLEDGTIMLFLPSLESRTFAFQTYVDIMVEEGRSQEDIYAEISNDIQRYQFNPLGFMLTDQGTMQKAWLYEEIKYRLAGYGFSSIDIKKFEWDWEKQIKKTKYAEYPKHWGWFVVIKR
ncbi:class I SAM-dependent methyltransferase [Maridesulfovibrio sp.]|uniref:class I SAM-dependent methyltransferase n=1 Tax=Maridesulfovibrio sp. TaxID=2795000 RepID=UPI002AA8AAFD|nr:class I SAM-dependent methyltransferase [Maridesulfovibrio sp.]